jgi:hypothetical protein
MDRTAATEASRPSHCSLARSVSPTTSNLQKQHTDRHAAHTQHTRSTHAAHTQHTRSTHATHTQHTRRLHTAAEGDVSICFPRIIN